MLFGVGIPEKIDINSLYICPHYLYTVTTLPWEIKNHFSTVFFIRTSDYYVISEKNKLQLLYCSLSDYLLLFTACYYLLSLILWSVFNLFGQSFSKPPMPNHKWLFSESPTFAGTHYLQLDVKV